MERFLPDVRSNTPELLPSSVLPIEPIVGAWQRAAIRILNADLGYEVPNFLAGDPRWIYLSDGGHADNLGVYALLERQCGTIIAVSWSDPYPANDCSSWKTSLTASVPRSS